MLKAETAAFDAVAPWLTEARWIAGGHPGTGGTVAWMKRAGFHVGRRLGNRIRRSGGFVARCLRVADPDIPLPDNPGEPGGWLDWGCDCAPQVGAVAILSDAASGSPAHVGFYVAEDGEAFHVLGGPRADAVSVGRHSKTRLLGFRWPPGHRQTGQRLTAPPEHADPT